MTTDDAPWSITAEVDVVDKGGQGLRLQFDVECLPHRIDHDLPVVGRFRIGADRCLTYLGIDGRSYVATRLHRPGDSLAEPEGDHVFSYPASAPDDRPTHHAVTGRSVGPTHYRQVEMGDPALARAFGLDVDRIVAEEAERTRSKFAERYVLAGGRAYARADFPTWRADTYLRAPVLDAPAHSEAPDRHILRFGPGRLEAAREFLGTVGTQGVGAAIGEAEFDPAYDLRDDEIRLVVAANAYFKGWMSDHVAGMPADQVRVWKSMVDVERSIAAGEIVPAREILAGVLGLMDHSERVGAVVPAKAGADWSNLRTRIHLEGVLPPDPAPLAAEIRP